MKWLVGAFVAIVVAGCGSTTVTTTAVTQVARPVAETVGTHTCRAGLVHEYDVKTAPCVKPFKPKPVAHHVCPAGHVLLVPSAAARARGAITNCAPTMAWLREQHPCPAGKTLDGAMNCVGNPADCPAGTEQNAAGQCMSLPQPTDATDTTSPPQPGSCPPGLPDYNPSTGTCSATPGTTDLGCPVGETSEGVPVDGQKPICFKGPCPPGDTVDPANGFDCFSPSDRASGPQ